MHLMAPSDRKTNDVEILIQHRFFGPIDAGSGDAFGLDQGANINLALGYSPTDRLSFGVSRSRWTTSDPVDPFSGKIVTIDGIFEIDTGQDALWDMDLRIGVEGQQNFHNHYSPFIELPTAFDLDRIRAYVVPILVLNSRKDEGVDPESAAVNLQNNYSFSLGLGADVMLNPRFSILGEYIPRLAGFGGAPLPFIGPLGKNNPTVGAGVKIRTWGHVFSVLLSTSRDFTPSQYGVNTGSRDLFLGFNI